MLTKSLAYFLSTNHRAVVDARSSATKRFLDKLTPHTSLAVFPSESVPFCYQSPIGMSSHFLLIFPLKPMQNLMRVDFKRLRSHLN